VRLGKVGQRVRRHVVGHGELGWEIFVSRRRGQFGDHGEDFSSAKGRAKAVEALATVWLLGAKLRPRVKGAARLHGKAGDGARPEGRRAKAGQSWPKLPAPVGWRCPGSERQAARRVPQRSWAEVVTGRADTAAAPYER